MRRGVLDGSALPESADAFFRLDRVTGRSDFPAGFGIVIALTEPAQLTLAAGVSRELEGGSTTLIPYGSGRYRIDGDALVARPPRP